MPKKIKVVFEPIPRLEFVVEGESQEEAVKKAKAAWAAKEFPWVEDAFELDDRGYRKD